MHISYTQYTYQHSQNPPEQLKFVALGENVNYTVRTSWNIQYMSKSVAEPNDEHLQRELKLKSVLYDLTIPGDYISFYIDYNLTE